MNKIQTKVYLYLGLSLPIITLTIFIIFALIGQYISPPQKNVLFIDRPYGFEFSIVNDRVLVTKNPNIYPKDSYNALPALIDFDPTTQTTTHHPITKQGKVLTIPTLKKQLKIDTSNAKDGYVFKCHNRSALFFLFIDTQENCTLSKEYFKNIQVKDSTSSSLFLGWVAK